VAQVLRKAYLMGWDEARLRQDNSDVGYIDDAVGIAIPPSFEAVCDYVHPARG
jgi:hypothetical protein